MIAIFIVQLMGGLGNQLFQYAAGRRLALARGVPLKMDLSWFDGQELRTYRLHHFNVSAEMATEEDIADLIGGPDRIGRIARLYWRIRPYYRQPLFRERHPGFDPNILKAPDNLYLTGYWQSEKYFEDIRGLLLTELVVRHQPDTQNRVMMERITSTQSVSLHVRRGDYMSNSATYQHYGVCSKQYYHAALERLSEEIKQPHIFVFSDDISWAEQNLGVAYPITYVKHNGAGKDYEDLRLMSQCKHNIIANSSFSWWGAWLNANPDKVVLAPRKWFKDHRIDTRDLLPVGWIRI